MEEELKKYTAKNLSYSLAVENYQDNTGLTSKSIENAWELLGKYRKMRSSLSNDEKLKMVKELSKRFDLAVKEIGVENFIFYDDGTINYIWKGGKNNE